MQIQTFRPTAAAASPKSKARAATHTDRQPSEAPADGVTLSSTATTVGAGKTRKTKKKAKPGKAGTVARRSLAAAAAQAAGATAGPLAAHAIFTGLQTGFVKEYIDPQATLKMAQDLAAKYPDLVEVVISDARSHGYDGKNAQIKGPAPLYYMRLGPKGSDRDKKVGVFHHASPHAREHVNPMTMMELANQLCANYDPQSTDPAVIANTRLMDKLDIFIAPQPNPDGANFSFYDDKGWRKNRSPFDGTDTGVDINRNYPYKWTAPDGPDYQTYPGKSPASEPETRALMAVVDQHPNIRFVMDWHSAAEEVRRPLGVSKTDDPVYNEFHGRVKDAIASSRGRQYRTVVSNVVEGASDDYWYNQRGIFSTVIETARSFQPAQTEALAVMTECARGAREALEYAADFADQYGLGRSTAPKA